MRIAFVNWSNRHVGGAETYIAQALSALNRAGHSLLLWHEGGEPQDRPLIERPAAVQTIDGAWTRGASGVRQLRDWAPDAIFVHGLVHPSCERAVLDVAPSVLFGHGYYGTCITGSKTRTLPVVAPCDRRFGPGCLAQFYPRRCGGRSPLTMWTEYRRQSARLDHLARYDAVVTFSEHMRMEFHRHGVPERRLHRVSPLVCCQPAADREVRPDGSLRLVFAGRLDVLKGCRVLIESLPAVRAAIERPLELVVAGSGPDESACRDVARAMTEAHPDVTVAFKGWLSKSDANAWLASADLLVMPSLWPEPLGLSGIEATSMGVPVAAFAVGGIPEWLKDGVNGALAPGDPPTSAGLAAAIARALTDGRIAEWARHHVPAASRDAEADHVKQLEQIFRGVVRSSTPSSTAGTR